MALSEQINLTADQLAPFAKLPMPFDWQQVSMQLNHADKRHISYCFVVQTDMGEQSVGTVAFDKTDVPRFYEQNGIVQTIDGVHWEQAIVMHDEEGVHYGAYGLTMAGVLAVSRHLCEAGLQNDVLMVRTDESNIAAQKFYRKAGLVWHPEFQPYADKKGKSELIPTPGRILKTTLAESVKGMEKYRRTNVALPKMLAHGR